MIWRSPEEAATMANLVPDFNFPESRVLIIITGALYQLDRK
jgi:hypothetical protein